MKNFKKIAGINLLILLASNVLCFAFAFNNRDGYVFTIPLAFAIVAQVVINFILAIYFFIVKKNDLGRDFILSMALVLLIGFSTCFGTLFLM